MARQIDRDCEFLEAEGIMDYSLLVGVHFRDDESVHEMGFLQHAPWPGMITDQSFFPWRAMIIIYWN